MVEVGDGEVALAAGDRSSATEMLAAARADDPAAVGLVEGAQEVVVDVGEVLGEGNPVAADVGVGKGGGAGRARGAVVVEVLADEDAEVEDVGVVVVEVAADRAGRCR